MAKAQGSGGSKKSVGAAGVAPGKVRRKFTLSAEAVRRLEIEALGRGLNPSDLLDDLVLTMARRFSLVDRGKGAAGLVPPSAGEDHGPAAQEARQGVRALGLHSEAG